MKTLIILFFIPIFSFAQINGVGIYRINKTALTSLDSIANSMNINKDVWDDKSENAKYLQPGVKNYFFLASNISGIIVNNVYVTFFHDTLISFKCDVTHEFKEALTGKYGDPEINLQTKIITCQNGFGAKFEHEEKDYTNSWNTGKINITAFEQLLIYYGDDCEKRTLNYFTIYDSKKKDRINEVERRLQKEIELKKKNEAAAKYKDF